MVTEISAATRTEVLGAIRSRYRAASKRDKSRMLDEFVAMAGCHRKHAVRLLGQHERPTGYSVPNVNADSQVRELCMYDRSIDQPPTLHVRTGRVAGSQKWCPVDRSQRR